MTLHYFHLSKHSTAIELNLIIPLYDRRRSSREVRCIAVDKSISSSELNIGVQQFLLLQCSGEAEGKSERESLQWNQSYPHSSTLLFLWCYLEIVAPSCYLDTKNALFTFLFLFHTQNGTTGILYKNWTAFVPEIRSQKVNLKRKPVALLPCFCTSAENMELSTPGSRPRLKNKGHFYDPCSGCIF